MTEDAPIPEAPQVRSAASGPGPADPTGSPSREVADFADVVVVGNGSAAAGVVSRFKELFAKPGSPAWRVLVLEADTEEQLAAQIPEFNARVTFPHEAVLPDVEDLIIAQYERVAFHSPRTTVCKDLSGSVRWPLIENLVTVAGELRRADHRAEVFEGVGLKEYGVTSLMPYRLRKWLNRRWLDDGPRPPGP